MAQCTYSYTVDGDERSCPRDAAADHDRCAFHLTPTERTEAGLTSAALRSAFLADVDADDPARREYVDVHLNDLDLSALVVDGSDVGTISFRRVTVDGTLDFSGAAVRHPVAIEESQIDRLDLSDGSFEMDVTIEGTAFGTSTCFRARRGSFNRNLELRDTRFDGSIEFAACRVRNRARIRRGDR